MLIKLYGVSFLPMLPPLIWDFSSLIALLDTVKCQL